jgi:hypothetical protein
MWPLELIILFNNIVFVCTKKYRIENLFSVNLYELLFSFRRICPCGTESPPSVKSGPIEENPSELIVAKY